MDILSSSIGKSVSPADSRSGVRSPAEDVMQAPEGDRARLTPADMQSAMDARQGVYGLGAIDN